nr:MAG TPA: helix-turn-helix domain protein [Bacteriophage sp.]
MLDGTVLQRLRMRSGKTLVQVADWCNVSKRYIIYIEQNKEVPSEETYEAYLNCVYGLGKPLPKEPRCNQTSRKKKSGEE